MGRNHIEGKDKAGISEQQGLGRAEGLTGTAEVSRNPAVAETVGLADRRLHNNAVQAVLGKHPRMAAEEALARFNLLAVLAEGIALRRIIVQPANTALLLTCTAPSLHNCCFSQ